MENQSRDYFDIIEKQFGAALGASEAAYREKVTFFIAHKDRYGHDISNIEEWIERAETTLSNIAGGATSIQVRGAWMGEQTLPLHEITTLVYSYASPRSIANSVDILREFLYMYGRETMQGEVVLSLENPDGDWFFRIPFTSYTK